MEHKRRLHIGVIISSFDNTSQYEIWNGIVEQARQNDVQLTAYFAAYQTTTRDTASLFETCYDIIRNSHSLDGIILFSGFIANIMGNEALQAYAAKIAERLPLVSISYIVPGIPSILIDNTTGMYDAVAHLVKVHGKRHIAFVKGPDGHPEAEERLEGYRRALKANGIDYDEGYVFSGNFSRESGQSAVEKMLEMPGLAVDAVAASNDEMAIGAIDALKRHNLMVPADIAVTGFDDDRGSATFIPSFSTVRQDFNRIGQISAETLLSVIRKQPVEEITYVPPSFMVRQSCGCLEDVFSDKALTYEDHRSPNDTLDSYVAHQFAALFEQDIPAPQVVKWTEALLAQIKERPFAKEKFLSAFSDCLIAFKQYSDNILLWNEALNFLTMGVELHHGETEDVNPILSTFILAATFVHDIRFKEGKIREFAIHDARQTLRRVASNLVLIFDIDTLADELRRLLPELSIHTAIIGLYPHSIKSNDPDGNRTIDTLIGFDKDEKFNYKSDNGHPIHFSDYATIGAFDFEAERRDILFIPLFFKDEEFGIMLMPFIPDVSGGTYETLRVNISTAIKGAELIHEIEYRNDLLNAVNDAATILLEPDVEEFEKHLIDAMGVVARKINVSRIFIWKNYMVGDVPHAQMLHSWRASEEYKFSDDLSLSYGGFEAWWETLSEGKGLNNYVSERPQSEWAFLTELNVKSFAVAPVILNDHFWGFVGFDDCLKERRFSENDEMVLRSVSKLIANALLRQEMARNLQYSLEQVVEASRAKSDFLSNMSHEMRTPMNAIIGMTSIGKKAKETEEKDHALSKIEEASSHLLGVINDVLDMSKIEANKLELASVEFDFQRMLQKVLTVIDFRLDEKKQVLSVSVDPKIPRFLVGDDQRMAQVITNLMSNAVKFTPVDGLISLDASLVGIIDGTCELRVSVADSGIGIAPDKQGKIFEAFEQAESGTSRLYGGTGLGLVITKRIVELMEGNIWVESELGKGAKFIFIAQLQLGENNPRSLLAPGVSWENVRILAVDDHPETRAQFQETFGELGVQCDVASDGYEAQGMIESGGGYDVYFVDWRMPRMDGIELTRYIKSRGGDKPSVVIMITAMEWDQIKDEAARAGVDKHLLKPLLSSLIIDTLNDCLGIDNKQNADADDADDRFTGKKMLLAEDIEINREILLAVLEDTGIEIDCAVNGREALDMVAADPTKYDIVFMDVQMPTMDGYEATRAIRALPALKDRKLPIIAMTANVFKSDIENCLAAGMDGHLGKPLDMVRVMEVLRKYL